MVALKKKMWVTREAVQWKIASDAVRGKLKREVQMPWGGRGGEGRKFAFIGSEVLLKITIL